MMQSLLTGLKSRSDEVRLQAAKDLQHYVSTELREASPEQHTSFMDDFNHHIFEMVSSSDANEKKGGIMAIGKAVNVSCVLLFVRTRDIFTLPILGSSMYACPENTCTDTETL
jgi:hypothetical protein